MINIQSLKSLFETIVKTNKIEYLSTYRLSQDHLELFFGCLRSHGGHNNKPNVNQFKAAYKKILANLELRDSFSGNCAPMDNFTILTSCSSVETVNSTCLLRDVENEEIQWDEALSKEFEVKVKLKVFLNSNIFESLVIHSLKSPAMLNHRLFLIRSIIETYANIKLQFVAKFDFKKDRKDKSSRN